MNRIVKNLRAMLGCSTYILLHGKMNGPSEAGVIIRGGESRLMCHSARVFRLFHDPSPFRPCCFFVNDRLLNLNPVRFHSGRCQATADYTHCRFRRCLTVATVLTQSLIFSIQPIL